jgi:hypothetical protein
MILVSRQVYEELIGMFYANQLFFFHVSLPGLEAITRTWISCAQRETQENIQHIHIRISMITRKCAELLAMGPVWDWTLEIPGLEDIDLSGCCQQKNAIRNLITARNKKITLVLI